MADKIRFLLLSKEGPLVSRIVEQMKTYPKYEIAFESTPRGALAHMESKPVDCLMLNIDHFGVRQLQLVEKIRKYGYQFQVFIFADVVDPSAEKLVEAYHNVVIFGKAYIDLDHDLIGICSRFYRGEIPFKRSHKRRPTRNKGLIENLKTGNKFSCVAFNLSEAGAYVEFGAGNVNVNDEIVFRVYLPRLQKTHVVKAKVVWMRTALSGVRAAGLKFLK